MKLTRDQVQQHKDKMQEPIILREQIISLQNLLAQKDNELVELRNELNQKNTLLSQKDSQINSLSSQSLYSIGQKDKEVVQFKVDKEKEITELKAEIEIYKKSALHTEKELSQKDFIIEFMSKNILELKVEKSELKEENKIIRKELVKNRSFQIDDKSLVISEYPDHRSELAESKVLGDSFSVLEEN